MNEDFNIIEEIEQVEEIKDIVPERKRACVSVVAIMLALMLVFSAAVPLTRFLFRKNYERHVADFPVTVCEQISEAGFKDRQCDSSLSIARFVSRTFPIGESKEFVATAMKGYQLQEKTGTDQPGCNQPVLWTFLVAKSALGWHTEVQFFFCTDSLIERTVLIDGVPVSLPTYDT